MASFADRLQALLVVASKHSLAINANTPSVLLSDPGIRPLVEELSAALSQEALKFPTPAHIPYHQCYQRIPGMVLPLTPERSSNFSVQALQIFIFSLHDTLAILQHAAQASREQLLNLHHVRMVLLYSIFQPYGTYKPLFSWGEPDVSNIPVPQLLIKQQATIGLALVRAGVLQLYAQALASRNQTSADASWPGTNFVKDALLSEVLCFLNMLFDAARYNDETQGRAVNLSKLLLSCELPTALEASSLVEHCCMALASQYGLQEPEDGPTAAATAPAANGIARGRHLRAMDQQLRSLLKALARSTVNILHLDNIGGECCDTDTTAALLATEGLWHEPCLQFLLLARSVQEAALLYGAPRFGLPQHALRNPQEGQMGLEVLRDQHAMEHVAAEWLLIACCAWESTTRTALQWDTHQPVPCRQAPVVLPYQPANAFLLCERVLLHVCEDIEEQAPWRDTFFPAHGLRALRAALQALPMPDARARCAPRAMRCMMMMMRRWDPNDYDVDEVESFMSACTELLDWPTDLDAASSSKLSLVRHACGPPSPEVAAALELGFVPALERVWRLCCAFDVPGLPPLLPLATGWGPLLAHAPVQQMAGAVGTLRKWLASAIAEVLDDDGLDGEDKAGRERWKMEDIERGIRCAIWFLSRAPATLLRAGEQKDREGGPPQEPQLRTAQLPAMGEAGRCVPPGAGAHATGDAGAGGASGPSSRSATAGRGALLPAQVPVLVTFIAAQWLPVVSRHLLACHGEPTLQLWGSRIHLHNLLVEALRWVSHVARQCRLSREAYAEAAAAERAAAGEGPATGRRTNSATDGQQMQQGGRPEPPPPLPPVPLSQIGGPRAPCGAAAAEAARAFSSWRVLLLADVRALDLVAMVLREANQGRPLVDTQVALQALDELIGALPEDVRQHMHQGKLPRIGAAAGASSGAGARPSGGASAAASAGTAGVWLPCGQGPVWLQPVDASGSEYIKHTLFAHLLPLTQRLPAAPEHEACTLVALQRPRQGPAAGSGQAQLGRMAPPCEAASLLVGMCSNPLCTNVEGESEGKLPLRVCARCGRARYCGRDCQLEHWPEHKTLCKAGCAKSCQKC